MWGTIRAAVISSDQPCLVVFPMLVYGTNLGHFLAWIARSSNGRRKIVNFMIN